MRNYHVNRYIYSLVLLVLSLFIFNNSSAQFFSFGTDPSRAKWNYVESENFKVIYPIEIDSLAKRYAWLLDNLKEPVQKSLNVKTRKLDVILHPYSAMSNGMVGLAPRRVELITIPPANDHYVNSWEKHVIAHELRHVGQVSKFEKGIFKPLSWVIGEQSTALGVGLFMSQWTLEGDAVVTETELSGGGRGRDPDHLIYYKAAFLDGDYRNWNRWTMGSYKDYVPSVYSFGYMYSSFVRSRANNYYYLGEVTDYVISHFYDLKASGKGYEKYTGLSKRENFNALKIALAEEWAWDDSLRSPFTQGQYLKNKEASTQRGSEYTKYLSPVEYNGVIYSLKSDLSMINRLVAVAENREDTFIKYMGQISSPLKVSNGKIYWTEYIGSTRWQLENFSDIFSYDIETGIKERLTKGKRYFNPSLSASGDTLLVVSYNIDGSSSLVVYSTDKMNELNNIPAPPGYRLKESALVKLKYSSKLFGRPADYIVVNATCDTGSAFFTLPVDSNPGLVDSNPALVDNYEWKEIIEPTQKIISDLSFDRQSGRLWFISDLDGVKNLYNYNLYSGQVTQTTNVRFGISSYLLTSDGSAIISDFSKNGYDLIIFQKSNLENQPSSFKAPYVNVVAQDLSKEAGFNADTLKVPEQTGYDSKRYRKGLNLFKVHSWAPLYYNIDNIKRLSFENSYELASLGATIYSQNSLNTAYAMAGYSWHNGFHSAHFNFTYEGLYPVIEVKSDINDRDRQEFTLERVSNRRLVQKSDTITGTPFVKSQIMMYLPLNFSKGGWSRGVVPRIVWRHTNDSYYSYGNKKFSNYHYMSAGVSVYSVLNMAHRDIFPRKGYGMNVLFSGVPFSGENFGTMLYSSIYMYAPGVIQGHGIRVFAGIQKQFTQGKNYLMSNAISFPLGYLDRLSKWAASINAQYAMPIYTGDVSLTDLLYIKRFRATPFISYCRNESMLGPENLYSIGSDLVLDLNLLTISYPLSLGVSVGYTGEKKMFFQLLFQTPL